MAPPRPFLSFGSFGESVRLLQQALNLAPSQLAKLKEDASFGPLTRSRVVEFQARSGLDQDGQVGPQTWGSLEDWIKLLGQMIAGASNPNEQAARAKVVEIAQNSLNIYGWPGGLPKIGTPQTARPDPDAMRANPLRIVAARCSDPDNPFRPRQGGTSLALIFSGAGGSAAGKVGLCPTIPQDIEALYNSSSVPPDVKRKTINVRDLGSWCGVFTMFVGRLAGMKYGGWPYKVHGAWGKDNKPMYPREACDVERFDIDGDVQKGDIGIFDYQGTNHHFLVVDTDGSDVITIDGNVGDPDVNTRFPWSSVVAQRRYRCKGKTSLMPVGGPGAANDKCYFMRPMWENLSKR